MQPSSSRPRNQARRRQNDDAAYMGPAKRQAADKADGEPRMKRKRVDVAGASAGMSALARRAVDRASDDGRRASVVGVLFFPVVLSRCIVAHRVERDVYFDHDCPSHHALDDLASSDSR